MRRLLCLLGFHVWSDWITSRLGDYKYCSRCHGTKSSAPFQHTHCPNCDRHLRKDILEKMIFNGGGLYFCNETCWHQWVNEARITGE